MKSKLPLSYAQTFLFVPGDRPDRFVKALLTNAHAIIIDLEDAVAVSNKSEARDNLRRELTTLLPIHGQRIIVRINAVGTAYFSEDLKLLSEFPIAAIMLPKAESYAQLDIIKNSVCDSTFIIPMIESAKGIDQLDAIASHPKTLRLTLGNIDLQADFGMVCDEDETELLPLRFQMTVVSRLHDLAPPIDGVTIALQSNTQLLKDTQRAKRIGFSGKLCVHPNQVDDVKNTFFPTEDEIKKATLIVQADKNSNGGVVQLNGRMIDRPVVILAQRILQLACQS